MKDYKIFMAGNTSYFKNKTVKLSTNKNDIFMFFLFSYFFFFKLCNNLCLFRSILKNKNFR